MLLSKKALGSWMDLIKNALGPWMGLTKNTLIPYVGRCKHALYHRQTFVRKLLPELNIKAQTLLKFELKIPYQKNLEANDQVQI